MKRNQLSLKAPALLTIDFLHRLFALITKQNLPKCACYLCVAMTIPLRMSMP